ncbi:glycosyltransferase [Salidesulfovibrio brasiliensis]|uniref:glycosyltransferase n=1 Tax=Salidesulfovibrio brasiliensis TaxID=221711 RepID=UPI0006D11DD1|nr:glycosyltransferase [Salidesulfovibrio brasiliensis]
MSDSVAVIIPCYNEEAAIGGVIEAFREALPEAEIYVYDNNSSDDTIAVAKRHGAIVGTENRQGKGNVVRRMFSDIDADIYVLADGDGTYDAPSAEMMIRKLKEERLDMVVGVRKVAENTGEAYRSGHEWGNLMFNRIFRACFGDVFTDILSGYRVFSRRFVKSFPALSSGFEIESEISIHAAELMLPVAEVHTPYYSRPEGSTSKLSTYRDGWRILMTIMWLFKEVSPLRFFGFAAALFALISMLFGAPVILTWLETGLVPRLPTAVLATGLGILSAVSLTAGLVLDSVCRGRLETKRLAYLGAAPKARR